MNLRELIAAEETILIVGHHNADPDAVCSMIAFAELYRSLNPAGQPILACDDISQLSKQVLAKFASDVDIAETVDEAYPFVVLVDTNSIFQLGATFSHLTLRPQCTLVIDHHEENPNISDISAHTLVDSNKSSTCEILASLYLETGVDMDSRVANLLLTGILFDTRRFLYADKDTFATTIRLIENGADFRACLDSLMTKPNRSERIARLKAAGRLRIHNIDDWLIVTATIGAFEASACRGLIELGADVAIVGGQPAKNVVRISSRSTRQFSNETGVNLGSDVMAPIGEVIGGDGGGHANAAGANGKQNRDLALERAVELIQSAIASRSGLS